MLNETILEENEQMQEVKQIESYRNLSSWGAP